LQEKSAETALLKKQRQADKEAKIPRGHPKNEKRIEEAAGKLLKSSLLDFL